MTELDGIFPTRVAAHLLEQMPDELSQVENGTLFVAWPKPPRVGRSVRLELSFGEEPPLPLDALVVWARPPRPGVIGGFRAQLQKAPPEVLERLRSLVEIVRRRLILRDVSQTNMPARRPPAPESMVITERIRVGAAREPTPGPRPLHIPTPVSVPRPPADADGHTGPEAAPPAEELELDASGDGDWRGGQPAFEPPAGQALMDLDLDLPPPAALELDEVSASQPALDLDLDLQPPASREADQPTTTPQTHLPETVDDLFADLASEMSAPDPPPPATSQPPVPVRVPFANGASYRMHYERFLQHGEVYVATLPAPAIGARCALVLLVPDGEAPVEADAIVVREVQPPQVPVRGWVAALVDPDGQISERLTTASFVLA